MKEVKEIIFKYLEKLEKPFSDEWLFESSEVEEKRQLLNLVFQNLKIRWQKHVHTDV